MGVGEKEGEEYCIDMPRTFLFYAYDPGIYTSPSTRFLLKSYSKRHHASCRIIKSQGNV